MTEFGGRGGGGGHGGGGHGGGGFRGGFRGGRGGWGGGFWPYDGLYPVGLVIDPEIEEAADLIDDEGEQDLENGLTG